MKKKTRTYAESIFYSFPIQLLVLHFRKNQVFLIIWFLMFTIILGGFGRTMGIPYLFLDPEYLDKVDFWSFLIMGGVTAGLAISFLITTYIIDAQRFNFLTWLPKPFSRYSLNNSVIPLAFFFTYLFRIIEFQKQNAQTTGEITMDVLGFITGFIVMTTLLFSYFRLTNKDIFRYVVCKLDEKIKEQVPATRRKSMFKYKSFRKKQVRVDSYFDLRKGFTKVPNYGDFYDKETLLQVFDQNHFNLITVQLVIFVVLLVVGLFMENPVFQIPAAASFILLLTILVMFSGAFSYWFRGWSISIAVIFILLINLGIRAGVINKSYKAFGIDYVRPAAIYNLDTISAQNTKKKFSADYQNTIEVLDNWKLKQEEDKPKMVLIAASGGGQRSMLWTLNALQRADSTVDRKLLEHTVLITGASGGLIGASYYRELRLREILGDLEDRTDKKYLTEIGRENLNPVIFSLLVNDLFLGFQKFDYGGFKYKKDRGYAFEQQLNRNTNGYLDRPLSEYRHFEKKADIPMVIMGPTIINDGRKMFISPLDVSYMNLSTIDNPWSRLKGVEFREFFRDYGADSLRFLSALRMNATFPYVTPNITLPSTPSIEIMDAGITDNYGVSDALRFLTVFSSWITENTSGVILLIVRDSQKNSPVEEKENRSLFQKFFSPIQGFYRNFESIQDINNDTGLEYVVKWFDGQIDVVSLEYNSANNKELKDRASLNWRLTEREKNSIIENIYSDRNRSQLEKLREMLE